MQQYFVKGRIQEKKIVSLEKTQLHHILHVMRMKQGDQIRLVDESQSVYLATLILQDEMIKALPVEKLPSIISKVSITLALALIKGERWDYAIQKCCELGVSRIQPIVTSRCVVKWKAQDAEKKQMRWNRIALEACEQCKRSDLVEVALPYDLSALIKEKADVKLLAYENADHESDRLTKLVDAYSDAKHILCVVGPEGGFSNEEVSLLLEHDFLCTSLGSRILRAETAAISIVNLLSSYYES